MKLHINVLSDLAALYHANEISAEGRALLEDLAKDDSSVAELLRDGGDDTSNSEIYRFSNLDELKDFHRAKWWRDLQFSTLIIGLLFTAFFTLHFLQVSGIEVFGIEGRGIVFAGVALAAWITFFVARHKTRIR